MTAQTIAQPLHPAYSRNKGGDDDMDRAQYWQAIKNLLQDADLDILRRVYNFVQQITLH